MKILWVSRHQPLKTQIEELGRLFGKDAVLQIDPVKFSSADDIMQRFRESEADEMVLVAPLSVCKAVLDLGIKPLIAHMQTVPYDSDLAEVKTDGARAGRAYRFVKFRRLAAIDIRYEEVTLDKRAKKQA